MGNYDFAARYESRPVRFISNGTQAAFFSKDGSIALALTVTSEPASGLPTVELADGTPFDLKKIARPCSCIGGVWKQRASELVAQL